MFDQPAFYKLPKKKLSKIEKKHIAEINTLQIKPFLSILLSSSEADADAGKIHATIAEIIETEGRKDQIVEMHPARQDAAGETIIYYSHYEVLKNPSWFKRDNLTDVENHIFITFNLNNTFAFYMSEKGMKDEIRTFFYASIT